MQDSASKSAAAPPASGLVVTESDRFSALAASVTAILNGRQLPQGRDNVRVILADMIEALDLSGYVVMPKEPTREIWAAAGNAVVATRDWHHDVVTAAVYAAVVEVGKVRP